MSGFDEREVHLRQRAARDWTEDADVRVCIEEIDRLRSGRGAAILEADELLALSGPGSDGLVLVLPSLTAGDTKDVLIGVLREQDRIRRLNREHGG